MASHKHLRTVIEDIYTNGNRLTEDLAFKLINEFRYSNLHIPAKREGRTLKFIIYEDDGVKITPLFTDHDEFRKFFADADDIQLLENPFELYRNILNTTEIEGYILNPSSEKYYFSKEFILAIKNIPKTNFYSTNHYTPEELKKAKDEIDNSSLESFIADHANIGDYESLMEELSKSTLLTLMLSDLNIEKDMIDLNQTGPVGRMHLDRIGGVYATLFTSEDKIRAVRTDRYKYSQLVNLATLVNFILTEDMDGIVLNPETDNVLIPRAVLLRYSLGIEKYANDERLCQAMFYMFRLKNL